MEKRILGKSTLYYARMIKTHTSIYIRADWSDFSYGYELLKILLINHLRTENAYLFTALFNRLTWVFDFANIFSRESCPTDRRLFQGDQISKKYSITNLIMQRLQWPILYLMFVLHFPNVFFSFSIIHDGTDMEFITTLTKVSGLVVFLSVLHPGIYLISHYIWFWEMGKEKKNKTEAIDPVAGWVTGLLIHGNRVNKAKKVLIYSAAG